MAVRHAAELTFESNGGTVIAAARISVGVSAGSGGDLGVIHLLLLDPGSNLLAGTKAETTHEPVYIRTP